MDQQFAAGGFALLPFLLLAQLADRLCRRRPLARDGSGPAPARSNFAARMMFAEFLQQYSLSSLTHSLASCDRSRNQFDGCSSLSLLAEREDFRTGSARRSSSASARFLLYVTDCREPGAQAISRREQEPEKRSL